MSRTINITVTNRTSHTLNFQPGPSDEGPACYAQNGQASVAAGGTITVTAENSSHINGGNKGTFQLYNFFVGLNFIVFYTHPQLSGTTYVQVQNAKTDPAGPPNSDPNSVGTYYQVYTGNPAETQINVYEGQQVIGTSGYAIPLADAPYAQSNNCCDFANSMFGPNMRDGSAITAAYNQTATPYVPADFTAGQMGRIVDTLYRCWTSGDGTDWPIVQFLMNYIAPPSTNNQPILTMWVPQIAYQANTSPSSYNLTSYVPFSFGSYAADGSVSWNATNVRTFLQTLAGGAHFVAISASDDFINQSIPNTGRDLYSAFTASDLARRSDPVNSHYATLGNDTGWYYLNIDEDVAPQDCGLILSLLFGRTVNGVGAGTPGTYNTFMQLEGWQAEGLGNTWHNADFNAYSQSLWNTATYGALPYSEKRATTIFLAPPGWTPQIYQITRMMPYVGAYASGTYPNGSPQGWLDPSLVSISVSAPALPARYYANYSG